MARSILAGTGSYLPARAVPNADLASFLDTTDEWIRERTGIGSRRIASDDEVTSDLATQAAARALEAAGRAPSEVDLLIVATVTPDSPMPACAVRVQHKLGLSPRTPAFDVSAACAGFLFGLTIADQFIRTGTARVVVVVGVELLSRIIDWTDRTTAVLFGDGAGAVVVEASDASDRGVEVVKIHSDGSLADALVIPAGGSAEPLTTEGLAAARNKVHMVGQEVFRAAVRGLGDVAEEVLREAALGPSDIDAFVFHQANVRIIDAVAERLAIPRDKLVLVLEETGNTSSASIPIALDGALRSGRVRRGDRVLLAALGAGVSWGGALVRL